MVRRRRRCGPRELTRLLPESHAGIPRLHSAWRHQRFEELRATSSTPSIRSAGDGSTESRTPPCTGAALTAAYHRSGSCKSIPNSTAAVTFPGMSSLGTDVPINRKASRRFRRGRPGTLNSAASAVKMHGAGAAGTDAAAELRVGQTEFLSQHPQQRLLGVHVELAFDAVDEQSDHGRLRTGGSARVRQ